jgi:hypothetical protein
MLSRSSDHQSFSRTKQSPGPINAVVTFTVSSLMLCTTSPVETDNSVDALIQAAQKLVISYHDASNNKNPYEKTQQ